MSEVQRYEQDFPDGDDFFRMVDYGVHAAVVAKLDAVAAALAPCGTRYLDPPDGGDVQLSEQVARLVSERDALARDMQGVRAVQSYMRAKGHSTHWDTFSYLYFAGGLPELGADSLPALGLALIQGGHVDGE